METKVNLHNIILIVVVASIVILFICLVALDIFLLFRRKVRVSEKELELEREKIKNMINTHEVESMNSKMEGQDKERKRIAQDLHDRLGSTLSMAKLHFEQVEGEIDDFKKKQSVSYGAITQLLNSALEEVRLISHDLNKGVLNDFGIIIAIKDLVDLINKNGIVKVHFEHKYEPKDDSHKEQQLYYITQELISNTLKYAQADTIKIGLESSKRLITLTFEDDGIGFDPAMLKKRTGFGYQNIHKRLASINGKMQLATNPNEGLSITIKTPHD